MTTKPKPKTTCPRCHLPWEQAPSSKLTCHARCVLTDEQKLALYDRYVDDPHLTEERLATQLGLSKSIIHVSLSWARRRRTEERAA